MMEAENSENGRSIVSVWTMEVATAVAIMIFAAVVMVSNYRIGAGWSSDGPEAGYFPFYIGLILFISGAAIAIGQFVSRAKIDYESFVEQHPFVRVLQILLTTILYVIVLSYFGIYVASAIFIAVFMVWLGRYKIWTSALVGIGFSVTLFLIFEMWFLVPLPKGPLESFLGY